MSNKNVSDQVEAAQAQPDELTREEFADDVVKMACETDPSDPDHPDTIKISTTDLRWAVLSAFSRDEVLAAQAQPVVQAENRCVRELRDYAAKNLGTYIFPGWDGQQVTKYLAPAPQSEPTT